MHAPEPHTGADPLLEFRDVSFSWPGQAGPPALRHVALRVAQGDFLLIRGPSGSGKSTLLRLALWLEEPQSGELLFQGAPYAALRPWAVRKHFGFVQQLPVLLPGSLRDNLLLPYRFAANQDRERPQDAALTALLESLGLSLDLEQEARQLSVGQQQRVCLARALLLSPELLLLDEPTSALDPQSRLMVERCTEDLNRRGVTILMVSHSEYLPGVPYRFISVRSGEATETAAPAPDQEARA